MRIIRTFVFTGLVIFLLPSNINPSGSIRNVADWTQAEAGSFCATRPNICIDRDRAWELAKAKALTGFELASELIWGHPQYREANGDILSFSKISADEVWPVAPRLPFAGDLSTATQHSSAPSTADAAGQPAMFNTLKPSDYVPKWQLALDPDHDAS